MCHGSKIITNIPIACKFARTINFTGGLCYRRFNKLYYTTYFLKKLYLIHYVIHYIYLNLFQLRNKTEIYPKVWLDDRKLESINDKRHTALIFREKIQLIYELILSKIFNENRTDELEFLKKYGLHIRDMFGKYSRIYAKTPQRDYLKNTTFNPNYISFRQMECHSLACNINHYMADFKPFISSTDNVRALNEFIRVTTTTSKFLENYISKSETFK